jgi:lipopolysaccharide export system permease protein
MKFARLEVLGRLDRYIGGLFVASYATALLLVVGLAIVLDLATHLSYFETWSSGYRVPGWLLLRYYVISLPFFYLSVAPFVTVVAGLFTVSRLLKKNELVAALSAGVSVHRLLVPVFGGGLLAALLMFGIREVVTPSLGVERENLYDLLERQRAERVLTNFWLRDVYGNVVRLREYSPTTSVHPFDEAKGLDAWVHERGALIHVRAERAQWDTESQRWLLEGGQVQEVESVATSRPIQWLEAIQFSPRDVLMAEKARNRPFELSFSEVYELARRDPDNTSYQTLLQYHLTFPLANIVLLMVALPFLLGRERGKGIEGLVEGCLMCVAYFCMDFITRTLGMDAALPPLIASWLPVLLFGSLGVALVHGMRS